MRIGIVLSATACAGCGADTSDEIPADQLQSARAVVRTMPSQADGAEQGATPSAFADDKDRQVLLGFHAAAKRLAVGDPGGDVDCRGIAESLTDVAGPSAVLAAAGRVPDPYDRTLWWNERESVGAYLSACVGGRASRDALVHAQEGVALVEARMRERS